MKSSESSKETMFTQTEQTCHLLTSTLSSLGADASAVVQLSSLGALVGVKDSSRVNHDLEERFISLDKAVSELESKMKVAREIVTEEQRALASLEASTEQAQKQNQTLKAMLKEATYQKENESISLKEKGSTATTSEHQAISFNEENMANYSSTQSSKPRRDSLDPRGAIEEHSIHLDRITQEELQAIPRTIRGRISLAVLNDALIEIEDGCRKKYVALSRQRRRQRAWDRVDDDFDKQLWISEQELRQTCSFFRTGESTARAILIILRSLNRLKQMPAKNGEVIYVLPLFSN